MSLITWLPFALQLTDVFEGPIQMLNKYFIMLRAIMKQNSFKLRVIKQKGTKTQLEDNSALELALLNRSFEQMRYGGALSTSRWNGKNNGFLNTCHSNKEEYLPKPYIPKS